MVAFRDDEQVQRNGAISVIFQDKGKPLQGSPDLLWKLPKLNEGCPMRYLAIHFCLGRENRKEKKGEQRLALVKNSYNESLKVRHRVHHGQCFSLETISSVL